MPEYDPHGPQNREAAKRRVAELLAEKRDPTPEQKERADRIRDADIEDPTKQKKGDK